MCGCGGVRGALWAGMGVRGDVVALRWLGVLCREWSGGLGVLYVDRKGIKDVLWDLVLINNTNILITTYDDNLKKSRFHFTRNTYHTIYT